MNEDGPLDSILFHPNLSHWCTSMFFSPCVFLFIGFGIFVTEQYMMLGYKWGMGTIAYNEYKYFWFIFIITTSYFHSSLATIYRFELYIYFIVSDYVSLQLISSVIHSFYKRILYSYILFTATHYLCVCIWCGIIEVYLILKSFTRRENQM